MSEMQNNIRPVRLISPVAAGTTGTGKTSAASLGDRQGYAGVEFIFDYGTVTATNATITVTVLEGDVTGTMTSVADGDLIGTEVLATLGQAATRTSGVSKNVSKRIGYKGVKRFVQVKMVPTVTATTPIAATMLLFRAAVAPTPNP